MTTDPLEDCDRNPAHRQGMPRPPLVLFHSNSVFIYPAQKLLLINCSLVNIFSMFSYIASQNAQYIIVIIVIIIKMKAFDIFIKKAWWKTRRQFFFSSFILFQLAHLTRTRWRDLLGNVVASCLDMLVWRQIISCHGNTGTHLIFFSLSVSLISLSVSSCQYTLPVFSQTYLLKL